MARAHSFDGMVFIPNCDKIVPGMLMAAARVNVPSIVAMVRCLIQKRCVSDLNSVFEAVGSVKAGTMTENEVPNMKTAFVSVAGLARIFTANSMNCLTEALGMALPETVPYPLYMQKGSAGWANGNEDYELRTDIKPSDILVPEAFENALAVIWRSAVLPIRYYTCRP